MSIVWNRLDKCSGGGQIRRPSAGEPAPLQVDPLVPPSLPLNHLVDEFDVVFQFAECGAVVQISPQRPKKRAQRVFVRVVKRLLTVGIERSEEHTSELQS